MQEGRVSVRRSGLRVWQRQKDYPHGTRARYVTHKCRCADCRRANLLYFRQRERAVRAGDRNGLVDTREAREHIRRLARAGVGYRMVADSAKVSTTVVRLIKQGKYPRARARTVRAIMAVTIDCRGDNVLVSGASTMRIIEKLLEEGFTKRDLARQLGYKCLRIQFKRARVTVKNRARVERLFAKLTT